MNGEPTYPPPPSGPPTGPPYPPYPSPPPYPPPTPGSYPAAHPSYDAPPPERRTSGWAILALVLSLFAAIPAFLGLWWTEGVALIVGVLTLATFRPERRRGRWMAILGCVLALLAGIGAFVMHRSIELFVEHSVDEVLRYLDTGDEAQLREYPTKDAPPERVGEWLARYGAAREAVGRYSGTVTAGNVIWGIASLVVAPKDVEELGGSALPPPDGEAVWARAKFERGEVWVSFSVPKDAQISRETYEEAFRRKGRGIVRDVRFFRAKGSG